MRLAVSSIAWKPSDDEAVAAVLVAAGVDAVELAPTAYWPDPLEATPARLRDVRAAWERRGLPVVAIQSLLFGFPALNLFDPDTRPAMHARLAGMLRVAAELGAGRLVLGSPRNRLRGELPFAEAVEVAVPFFGSLGEEAARLGVCLCVEPNPPAYGCDFVTTAAEGRRLVERVGSPGFGLHLDTAGMVLAGDEPLREIELSAGLLRHVHFSAPQLGPVGPASGIDYAGIAARLRGCGYSGIVSIEMRAMASLHDRLNAVAEAAKLVRAVA